jgi:hypothetical protein
VFTIFLYNNLCRLSNEHNAAKHHCFVVFKHNWRHQWREARHTWFFKKYICRIKNCLYNTDTIVIRFEL